MKQTYDYKKGIKAFNERLRVARSNYDENSAVVKKMIDRAKMLDLEWTDKGISTKKENIAKLKTIGKKRFEKYIKNTSAAKIVEKTLSEDQIKDTKKYTGKERYNAINEIISSIVANKELLSKIYDEMYDASYSIDDCNTVYDELKAGKFQNKLQEYIDGVIDVSELADYILNPDNSEEEQWEVGDLE